MWVISGRNTNSLLVCLLLGREEDPRIGQPGRGLGLQSGNHPVKSEPRETFRSVLLEIWSGHVKGGRVSCCLYLPPLIYSEIEDLYINRLTCLDLVLECFLFLKMANRATLLTFVFLTKQLHRSEAHVHSSSRPCSASLSLFSFSSFIQKWSCAQPLIHLTCWHWMYLHWCFLNGHRGKYLKCHKYAHGLAQTYQDSSKPPRGLGWVALCLPQLFTSGPWVLVADGWYFTQFMDLYLSVLIYFCLCLSIYDWCVNAFVVKPVGCIRRLLFLYFCDIFCFPYSNKTIISNGQLSFCCQKQGRLKPVSFYIAFIKQK